MRRVVATGVLVGTLLSGSLAFGQSGFAASRAPLQVFRSGSSTRAMPEQSADEVDFDESVDREVKLIAFTRRLEADRAEQEEETFDQGVSRYLKAVEFVRRLEEQREAAVEAAFDEEIALASRVMKVMQHLDTEHTLVPEPVDWIRGPRAPSSGSR